MASLESVTPLLDHHPLAPKAPRLPPFPTCQCGKPHKTAWRIFALAHVNGENLTRAYMFAYPKVAYLSARSAGARLLAHGCVQTEITRIRKEREVSQVMDHESELVWNMQTAKDRGLVSEHREAVKAHAQLVGRWKDRHEVEQIDPRERDAIRQLVAASLSQAN